MTTIEGRSEADFVRGVTSDERGDSFIVTGRRLVRIESLVSEEDQKTARKVVSLWYKMAEVMQSLVDSLLIGMF